MAESSGMADTESIGARPPVWVHVTHLTSWNPVDGLAVDTDSPGVWGEAGFVEIAVAVGFESSSTAAVTFATLVAT